MSTPSPTKTCTVCRRLKPTSQFTARRTASDGCKSHCKACHAANAVRYRETRKRRMPLTVIASPVPRVTVRSIPTGSERDAAVILLDRLARTTRGCWEWQAERSKYSYGRAYLPGQLLIPSHRLAYLIFCGSVPPDMCVLHHCDNPPCCNPTHLFLGTDVDNTRDKVQKGRQARGESHPSAKLTAQQVLVIYHRIRRGESVPRLAEEFHLNPHSIRHIGNRKRWAHILPPETEETT